MLLAGAALAPAASIEILSVEPTVLFPKQEPLRQIAWVQAANRGAQPVECGVRVQLDGADTGNPEKVTLTPGVTRVRALVPDISSPRSVTVSLVDAGSGAVLASREQAWQPQRHWKVYLMKSSHEDLGYENYIFHKQHEIATFIDLARGLSGLPGGAAPAYHYTMESLLFQRNYLEERSEAAWREIVEKHLKTGRMGILGTPHGVHAHWMDYEELARMTYPGRREAKDRFGLDLKTFLIVDNPSMSWAGCQAIADAGFRYMARWGQGWRTGGNNDYRTTKVPAIFWWVAPNGTSRVLYAWRSGYGMSFWFGQSRGYGGLLEAGADNVNRILKSIESGAALGPYPYDALVNPEYTDHEIPFSSSGALRDWAHRYRYPEIRTDHPERFFEYIEQKYGAEIPSLAGDLNNFSADYASIDPESQGWKRRAARRLPLAEGVAALANLLDPAFLPPAALIERTFTRLFDYDEHSWPTLPRASDVQLFNAQWVKQHEARRALDGATKALDLSFRTFARHIPTGAQPALVVFNPLAHERTDLVETESGVEGLADPATGKPVVIQKLPDGRTVFVAERVPAFGYKVYRFGAGGAASAASPALTAAADRLANQYYEIRFDRATGTIRGIFDKELKRELVDQNASRRFNQLVYVHKDRDPDFYRYPGPHPQPGDFEYSPAAAQALEGRVGPLRAEMTARIEDPKIGGHMTQTVILYDGLKRIDIVNDLRAIRALYSDRYEDRYRDNLYYAFPIQVDNFQARAEAPGGVVRPYHDQLRWGSHDYLMANRWVDVSNREYGVTMAPVEAFTINFGAIRYNQFSIDYQPASSHLYSYAYSNRMASLLALQPEDYNATLRYSFTSHAGDWNTGAATRLGWSVASPLEARRLPAGQNGPLPGDQASFVSVSLPNVQMVTLKQSEQPGRGWILRLVETEGKGGTVRVQLPRFPITGAMRCDLVENDQQPLEVRDRSVTLNMGPFAFATVRLYEAGPGPGAVEGVAAEMVSDQSIRLRWKPVPGAVYNLYRSEDPGAPPTAYSLAGRAAAPPFVDTGLKLDTEYHYFVAAVTPANQQGPVSGRVTARTAKANTSPPRPVEELGVVRRAGDRLMVYWRKSPDPDIARFLVYRGERPDFAMEGARPVAVVRPSGYFLETFMDTGLTPGRTYYYRVLPEDWAGHRQTRSALAQATTPAR
jgi:hypothetical protein